MGIDVFYFQPNANCQTILVSRRGRQGDPCRARNTELLRDGWLCRTAGFYSGDGYRLKAETVSDALVWGLTLAIVLSLVRFIEFAIQEVEWMAVQIQLKGYQAMVRGFVRVSLLLMAWYAFVLFCSATVIYYFVR